MMAVYQPEYRQRIANIEGVFDSLINLLQHGNSIVEKVIFILEKFVDDAENQRRISEIPQVFSRLVSLMTHDAVNPRSKLPVVYIPLALGYAKVLSK